MTQRMLCSLLLCLFAYVDCAAAVPRGNALQNTIRKAQRKVVKIYGAGGFRQMEAYQSGILISDEGQVLTALSYVLDTDDLVAILDNGRRLKMEIVGSDPVSELAVLQPKEEEAGLPHFNLGQTVSAVEGQRVLALSNLYNIATGYERGFDAQINVASLDGANGFAMRGINRTDELGSDVAYAGDANGDGRDDLLISADLAEGGDATLNLAAGETYLIFGKEADHPAS